MEEEINDRVSWREGYMCWVSKIHLKGYVVWECRSENEGGCDSLKGGLVWAGVEEGRGMEGCALLF